MCGVGAEGNPVGMAVTSLVSLSLDRRGRQSYAEHVLLRRMPAFDGAAFVPGAWGVGGMEAVR